MATDQGIADFIVDQLSDLGEVRARKMFGEYGVYYRDKLVALICDDLLFVKITAAGKEFLGDHETDSPYPGAKPCFLMSEDECEDRESLAELVRRTFGGLPPPKGR